MPEIKLGRSITAAEIWRQPEPPEEMIWEICPYIKGGASEQCLHCPPSEVDRHNDSVVKGCRVLAAEACRVVMAMQARRSNAYPANGVRGKCCHGIALKEHCEQCAAERQLR